MGSALQDIDSIIVSDNRFQLKLLANQLSIASFRSITAFDDIFNAMDHLSAHVMHSAVVFLDLNMENNSGLEFLKRLGKTEFGGSIALLTDGDDIKTLQAIKLARTYELRIIENLQLPAQDEELDKLIANILADFQASNENLELFRYSAERLQEAIEKDELFNVYQPKVLLSTGELIGVEALVRWKHPEDGEIYPDQFIKLAEEADLIDTIARKVLSNALHDSRAWRDKGLDITISVNISMYNLNTRDFVNFVEDELATSGLDPQNLTLEVAESRLVKDYSLVLDMLTRLRLRRVNLSIDDFGYRNASMSDLKNIPISELKIDREFVHSAWDNEKLHEVFDDSMQMARNLGVKTVAEGVESEEDFNFSSRRGCDQAQGYFIGKPMRSKYLMEWRDQWLERYSKIAV